MASRIARRSFLIGGSALLLAGASSAVAVNEGILPGRATAYREFGLDGVKGVVPATSTGRMVTGSFVSKARLGRRIGWGISYPPGSVPGDRLPVAVVLHGFGVNHTEAFGTKLGLDHFLAAAVRAGTKPFAIAAVDGGNTYWHRRTTGEDSGEMVSSEFLPLLASKGLDTAHIALLGWSMGAYGALLIGSRLGSGAVAAIAAESVALWHTAAQAAGGAFDGESDFAAHTLFGKQQLLADIPVRIDCGTGDGFYPNDRDYVDGFPEKPTGSFSAGAHNLDYWRRMAPAQLEFIGKHLA